MGKISKYFYVEEFVPPEIFSIYGDKSIWFVDKRLVTLSDFTRGFFGRQMIINDWLWKGSQKDRGFRMPNSTIGSTLSQHHFGRAEDYNIQGLAVQEVYQAILANAAAFMAAGLTAMEDIASTTTHTHNDCRWTGLPNILIVQPS